MSSSVSENAPVASRTRAGIKRTVECRGTRFLPVLDRIQRRVESLDRIGNPVEVTQKIELKVALIQLRMIEARVRELEENLERMRDRVQNMEDQVHDMQQAIRAMN